MQYIDSLEEIAQTLADRPDMGLKREALSVDLLSFPYQRHVLYYVKKSNGISIVRVLHASMDSSKHISHKAI